ncbi:MAG: hypothetical protein U0822_21960 [Anaerolineae bacterium]
MSASTTQVLFGVLLLIHGLGHIGALAALPFADRSYNKSGWRPARSWLFPKLAPRTARLIASVFWALSAVGFIAAALAFWGILLPTSLWQPLAVVFAIISTTGIVLFFGTWPMFNTVAALAVNIAVFVCVFWLHWPSST